MQAFVLVDPLNPCCGVPANRFITEVVQWAALVSTGVPEFDRLLGDGFPEKSAVLVRGSAGSGKEALAYRFVLSGVNRGDFTLFLTHRSVEDVLADAHGYGADIGGVSTWIASEGGGMKYDPENLASLSFSIKELLKKNSSRHITIVGDDLSSLLMLNMPETVYRFLRQLLEEAKRHHSVMMATLDEGMHRPEVLAAMEQLFDGVIEFELPEGDAGTPVIRVKKMRGVPEKVTFGWTGIRSRT